MLTVRRALDRQQWRWTEVATGHPFRVINVYRADRQALLTRADAGMRLVSFRELGRDYRPTSE